MTNYLQATRNLPNNNGNLQINSNDNLPTSKNEIPIRNVNDNLQTSNN